MRCQLHFPAKPRELDTQIRPLPQSDGSVASDDEATLFSQLCQAFPRMPPESRALNLLWFQARYKLMIRAVAKFCLFSTLTLTLVRVQRLQGNLCLRFSRSHTMRSRSSLLRTRKVRQVQGWLQAASAPILVSQNGPLSGAFKSDMPRTQCSSVKGRCFHCGKRGNQTIV